MSDDELEIIFENVIPGNAPSVNRKDNSTNSPRSSPCNVAKVPRLTEEYSQKIKLDTSKYIKERLGQLQDQSTTKPNNLIEQNQSVLNLKSVKHANGTKRKKEISILDKDISSSNKDKNSLHNGTPSKSVKTPTKANDSNDKAQSSASPSSSEQNVKLSRELSKRPNQFSINGSPASSRKNRNVYSNGKKTPMSVHNTSPLTFMRNKFDGKRSFSGKGVKRRLNFSSSPQESSTLETSEFPSFANTSNEVEPLSTTSQNQEEYLNAYLLKQLDLHVRVVLEHDNTNILINEEESEMINKFFAMSFPCRDLYVRMHHRKYKWNRLSDVPYVSATEENLSILKENGFIVTDMQNVGIESLLNLLKVKEVKELSKSLGIKCSVGNKKNIAEDIIRYSQQQKTIDFKLQVVSSEELVRKKIKKVLGRCFILSSEPRGLFRRIHLLFNLKFNRNEQSRFGSQDLFGIQFMGTEKALYPKYDIDKKAKIFASREELLRYQTAEDLKAEFYQAVDAKEWVKAEAVLCTVRCNFLSEFDFISELVESPTSTPTRKLPLSLRKFTPGTVYAFILSEGVDILKKLKKKDQAINDILLLLDQNMYLPYLRARWYEKLIIIYRTAGQLKEVAKTICAGIRDPHVDDQGSYLMSCRIREILRKKKKELVLLEAKSLLKDVPLFPPLEMVEPTEIKASALDGKAGYRRVFVQDDGTGDGKIYSSVEELVINYYCPRFFQHGIHSENSLASSLFGILFWDVIYEYYVPCAFISPFQTKPLDLSSGEFYKNREPAIEAKFAKMKEWTTEEIASWVKEVYEKQNGRASIVQWRWFRSSEHIVDIITCIGLEVILKICERYAKKYRGVRSGFPDLFLWTPGQKDQYKFIEVKGPNDRLGPNQKLWLDFLLKINANVEVCLVQADGSKAVKSTVAGVPCSENKSDAEDETQRCDVL